MATSGRQRSNRSANGTVIITGANGSLGLAYVQQFLQDFPSYFAIFAVRNDSDEDPNTAKLRQIASKFKDAKFSVEAVDLSSIKNVKAFSENIANRVSSGEIPQISAIVCNAFNWSLTGQKMSADGMDLAFEVSQLSHYILVLKLLGSMNKSTGRIAMLGSDAHDSNNKNSMNPLGAQLPSNLEQLVHPTADKPGEEQARGFQRYANSKLANIMFMHALNRKLQNNLSLRQITATAMDPGGMPTSRAFDNAPVMIRTMMYVVGHVMLPVLKHFTDGIKTTKASGHDLAILSVGDKLAGARGYFIGQKAATSSVESQDENKQEELWAACGRWAKLDLTETAL